MGKYVVTDYTKKYKAIMQFGKNKAEYIHRWYPFVEGYSKEFIYSILQEYEANNAKKPQCCLEPFSGSGTTALELQKQKIKCYAFEVSPFMYNLSRVKLNTKYTVQSFSKYYEKVKVYIHNCCKQYDKNEIYKNFNTMVRKKGRKKWIYNDAVLFGVEDIKCAISKVEDSKYQNLFQIALSSILLEVSNVYRNGKCISYKKEWKTTVNYTREEVHDKFLEQLSVIFLDDIKKLNRYKSHESLYSNYMFCYAGDCRQLIDNKVDDDSIDLIITSPPYLNSRDYTDSYMVELRTLEYLKDHKQVRDLRSKTLRSHVQVKWEDVNILNIEELDKAIYEIKKHEKEFWNASLLNMIKGYFEDMDILFSKLYPKLTKGGYIYFNIANSAYYNVEIKVDEILCEIAENIGFDIIEIREARKVKPSSQQHENITGLRESVIVMKKN